MSQRRVWIAQCLCPSRHAILAAAGEANSEAEAQSIRAALLCQTDELISREAINPWCAICGAKLETWTYEVGRTAFKTMAEAMPTLRQEETRNVLANAAFGDIHKRPPN
jgi:hypothetical protein